MKKSVALLAAATLLFSAAGLSACGKEKPFTIEGKTVILTTSSIRGNLDLLPKISSLKKSLEEEGASVLLVDAGNFLQGTVYTSYDSGKTMVSLMKEAGYDAVTIGSHEFDFGTGKVGVEAHEVFFEDGTLGSFLKESELTALSANITTESGDYVYSPCVFYNLSNGDTVALVGITDEHTPSHVLESNVASLSFNIDEAKIDALLATGDSDYAVGFYNAPGTSSYFPGTLNVDIVMSGHSDMPFYLSAIAFNEKGQIKGLSYDLKDYEPNAELQAKVDAFKSAVDADEAFSSKVTSEFTLNGSEKANRSRETNLGDFFADAIRYAALTNEEISLKVEEDKVVALWNGGNLRDYLNSGDVTMKDIKRVLPYPNKVSVAYLTGAQLVEALEAASQGLPYTAETNASLASFMQVSGLKYTVNLMPNSVYERGEPYGKYWYTDASVGSRVTITEVNGKEFNAEETYAVVTSNAVVNGMDANYIFKSEGVEKSVSSVFVTDAVFSFVKDALGGSIGKEYATSQGRITFTY